MILDDGEGNVALIMGGSGTPIPSETYIQNAFLKYVQQNSPEGTIPQQLVTPEGLYPITPYPYVKVLPLSVSVDQGNQILYDEILRQIEAGNTLTVFGYSQSAIISSLVMDPENAGCVNTPTCGIDPDTPINFVLIGNEMNPNGGFLSRFPGLNLPSLGIPFYGGTPEDSFPVANYMLEYDGFADFPQYPINFLADLNAALGIAFVHGTYLNLTQEQIDAAIELPTSTETQKYYVIPTENLPLVQPIRLIPLIGDPIADLLEPALRVLVNLGYGDPKYGWSQGTANVETPFGFIPDVDWGETFQLLVDGVVQGVQDFWNDIKPGGSMWQELSANVAHMSASVNAGVASLHALAAGGIIPVIQEMVNKTAQFVSNAAASLYAALLPTADIVNAIVTMLPAYGIDLFLDGVQQVLSGDIISGLLNAVGLPWAAGVGLVTTSVLIEFLVIANAITGIFTID
ncbi:MAG: PE-PPE domain-containing protein [Mycobacterium sp.]